MSAPSLHPDTLAIHGGFRKDPATNAVAVPIYQTTSYAFDDTGHAARLFELSELGNIYSRIMNPTNGVLEERAALLEGGVAALAVSSGQSASTLAILNLCRAGDNFVTSTDLYGGTWTLFSQTLKNLGIEARFADPSDPESFRRETDDKTRCYYAETLPNPKLNVFPIAEVAAIGRDLGVPLIADNTAAPLICRPIDHGAAIVVYSATKFMGGHGTSIGGLIIDSGQFDWEAHAVRFPNLSEPDESYHGAIWIEAAKPLGPIAYALRARTTLLRDMGPSLSPFNAFMILQGLETLPLRMARHGENAAKVAAFLKDQTKVSKVIYPGLQKGDTRRRADAYLTKGNYGALVGFELIGGRESGEAFINALGLLHHLANIGDARSLAIHPASTTHQQLTADEQLAAGVSPGYVRLSIGLEHIDDILSDLEQALEAA